jgi:hypothetical protein
MSDGAVFVKNPRQVESGHRGALKRWDGGRIARLDDLSREEKALVLALIEAARARPKPSEAATDTAA